MCSRAVAQNALACVCLALSTLSEQLSAGRDIAACCVISTGRPVLLGVNAMGTPAYTGERYSPLATQCSQDEGLELC